MDKIKLFSYLDEYKMYSISSQIFQGLTESTIKHTANSTEETEQQNGPFASGKVLADIASRQEGTTENRFLYDYAYTLFEQKLLDDNRILVVDASNIDTVSEQIGDYAFIKVTGQAIFNDMRDMTKTINQINQTQDALAVMTNHAEVTLQTALLTAEMTTTQSPNRKKELQRQIAGVPDAVRRAKGNGGQLDKGFVEKLAYVLQYGYQDEFEVQMTLAGSEAAESLFTATLNRSNFTEADNLLVRKYSRVTQKPFTLFGIVAQDNGQVVNSLSSLADAIDADNTNSQIPGMLRRSIRAMLYRLSDVDSTFVGRLANEIIIDPIALYREL